MLRPVYVRNARKLEAAWISPENIKKLRSKKILSHIATQLHDCWVAAVAPALFPEKSNLTEP